MADKGIPGFDDRTHQRLPDTATFGEGDKLSFDSNVPSHRRAGHLQFDVRRCGPDPWTGVHVGRGAQNRVDRGAKRAPIDFALTIPQHGIVLQYQRRRVVSSLVSGDTHENAGESKLCVAADDERALYALA